MSRDVRRVPLDFDWPLYKTWKGFVWSDEEREKLTERTCFTCGGSGYSAHAKMLQDRWYGYIPFDPKETGSTPFTADHPAIRAGAERNIEHSPDYYLPRVRPVISWDNIEQHEADIARARANKPDRAELVERATVQEAQRLADHFNNGWSYHVDQGDVDALIAAGRLYDFTHTWTKETRWQPIDPPPKVTAAQVNEWSIAGMGHDSVNCWVVVKARCERDGQPYTCGDCDGDGSFEVYPGQRADAEAWERTDPPKGDGWQMWESTSEGSPISPVFATPEELAAWISNPDRTDRYASLDLVSYESALRFVNAGWAPSGASVGGEMLGGVEFAGRAPDDSDGAPSEPDDAAPLISDATLAEVAAMEERDRAAGGPPWEVTDHPDHQQPGGWHRGQLG